MRQLNPALDPQTALADWSTATSANADPWTHYTCKLVTPLYGGGVRAAEVDTAMPIRAAGIRGQLRFWWRIANGPFASSAEMFQREVAIWGGIGNKNPVASKVAVRIDRITGQTHPEPAFIYQSNPNKPGELKTMPDAADWIDSYALFPARGELTKDKRAAEVPPHKLIRAGLGFRLGVRDADLTAAQRAEVTAALRWWASFGGVGARTRRGLGAVQVSNLPLVTAEEVAQRGGQLCVRAVEKTAELAWKMSVTRLRDFRQGIDLGRDPRSPGSESPAGRSRWPEPDIIRHQTRRHSHGHQPTHPVTTVYPRAAFGLPIVFHFKDENKGEPPQQLLVPDMGDRKGDRMASQLILRPYWDGKNWRPAALLLPGWEAALTVRAGFGDGTFKRAWPTAPAERQQLAAQIEPMQKRGDDPLTAFLHYFEER
ncbi:type III-B CRISPR module RAMP protein Cmr1 [Thiospirillum jenense]|uniref:Type III-B CRISPR module RAMP protein Cmr1 n=1 Tax=Thiospirillum jenense TaxID=1653858 RepID=A0A839H9Y5_9GAMM|nr:type III-B CRISPR module RAMP protein Cmr1 [Thiospirillum jenense]MBB1125594.1 type III-B CRISPR module RAMP protein Cmr1 [Thiospirillum jenense]